MTHRHNQDKKPNAAGSLTPGEPAFLAVGKLRRPHGVLGEMQMDVLTDFPERLVSGIILYVGNDHLPVRLQKSRPHQQALLMTFEDYTTPEAVGELRNQIVYVRTEDRPPLEPGEYYHHQLIGLRVIDENGIYIGTIAEILETGANDIYVVRPEMGPEILLPAIDSVEMDVNLQDGVMRVHILPGLIPD
jgi:16S rRNA processing protein RimM